MTEDLTPATPIAPPAKPRRRENLVEIEAPQEVNALALILGQTPEEFVAAAVAAHVAVLTAKIKAQVTP